MPEVPVTLSYSLAGIAIPPQPQLGELAKTIEDVLDVARAGSGAVNREPRCCSRCSVGWSCPPAVAAGLGKPISRRLEGQAIR
jgi:hypothetical protein